jgi:hypothetical protein
MSENESREAEQEVGPVKHDLPTHSEDGIDLTLIRWMLSLTPVERLQVLEERAEMILRLRHARPVS